VKAFISGGCKNGKSYLAARLVSALDGPHYYIATMIPSDDEDDERIIRHRREREGLGFVTVELPRDIDRLPANCDPDGSFLLDSATALLANEMFSGGGYDADARVKVCRDVLALIGKVRNIVVVSDNIYSDAFIYDEMTENYRRSLGCVDRAAAGACDAVIEATFGGVMIHRDTGGFAGIYEKII